MTRSQSLLEIERNTDLVSSLEECDFELPLCLEDVSAGQNIHNTPQLLSRFLGTLQDQGLLGAGEKGALKRHFWTSLNITTLASLTGPQLTFDQLLCYTLWMSLVYTIDDIRDKFLTDYEPELHSEEQFREWEGQVAATNEDILNLVDAEATEMPVLAHFTATDPVVRLARHLRSATLRHFDGLFYDEFVGHLRDHLQDGVTLCAPYINLMKQGKPFPLTMTAFERLRTKDAAGSMCVHLAGGLAYGRSRDDDILSECLYQTALHAAILNDIFSYEKQVYVEKDRFNYVCGVTHHEGTSFNEAVIRSVDRANECVRLHGKLSKMVDPEDAEAQSILQTHRRWFAGHIVWVKACGRYSTPTSPFLFLRNAPSTIEGSLAP